MHTGSMLPEIWASRVKLRFWTVRSLSSSCEGCMEAQSFMVFKSRLCVQRRQIGAALSGDAVNSYLPTVESLVRSHLQSWQESGEFDLEAKVTPAEAQCRPTGCEHCRAACDWACCSPERLCGKLCA